MNEGVKDSYGQIKAKYRFENDNKYNDETLYFAKLLPHFSVSLISEN